ncbi:MAG TPA: large conductance mechanosensitive channel protein MscL [Tepidisphaeraceae bacterium]|nr:large conductance mechanosensitive channel protein MscL [Tepidisphaeraceae bacterium]
MMQLPNPKPSQLWAEFKAFAFKGNLIDLAVAVVIGAAFSKVIDAVVKDIIMPLVSYLLPGKAGYESWHLGRLMIGHLLAELLNFLIVAAAVFLVIVKLIGAIMKKSTAAAADEPATKECPLCLSVIPAKATRCSQCTADLPPAPANSPAT